MGSELARIAEIVDASRPRRIPGRSRMTRSAVAAILREAGQGVELLLVQRARRVGDPWSGDMAFPGGRQQTEDRHSLDIAIRETAEETGIVLDGRECIGRLSDVVTRKHEHWRPMVVTPWLFRFPDSQEWDLNRELVDRVWMPLALFADKRQRQYMIWRVGPMRLRVPVYRHEGYKVWGLTLMMIDGLLATLRKGGYRIN